ncbi:MAG: hypothetical protein ABFS32_21610 [Bacteroidota bacterium]
MNQKKSSKIALVSLIAVTSLMQRAEAMPMFTTQTGMDCAACHTQSMPKLNAMGRQFMVSGMTMSQNIDEMNSGKSDLNPSLLLKLKYEKSWDKPTKSGWVQDDEDSTNEGQWSVPRTASVLMGGRVTENVGGLLRLSYRDEHDASIAGKAIYADELENGYWGAAVYSESNFGPFSGMEVYNTGLYKPLRTFEGRKLVNATQACSVGTGEATGLQVYYDKDSLFGDEGHFFGSIGMYAPGQDNSYMNLGSNLLPFARIAYEYPVGDYNLIFGGFAIVGGSTTSDGGSLSVKRETYGLDFQLEGEIAEKSISIIATNIFKNDVQYTGMGAGSTEDLQSQNNDAFSIEGEIMMTSDVGLKLAYLRYNDRTDYEKKNYINVKDLDYAITAGVDYSFIVQVPMKVALEYSWANPGLDRVKDYQYAVVTLTLPF